MKNNYAPYKNCKQIDITQGFHDKHKAVDLCPNIKESPYGKWLVAPETVKIINIDEAVKFDGKTSGLENGYGLCMQSVSDKRVYYVYWHCLFVFPVNVGDTVLGGEEVAQMGNSGTCYSSGTLVPLIDRLRGRYPGTHLHYEKFIYENGASTYVDPTLDIDWNKQPSGNFLKEMLIVLQKMSNLLK